MEKLIIFKKLEYLQAYKNINDELVLIVTNDSDNAIDSQLCSINLNIDECLLLKNSIDEYINELTFDYEKQGI